MKNKLALSLFLLALACSKGNFAGDGAVTQTAAPKKGTGDVNSSTVDGNSGKNSGSEKKDPTDGTVIGSGGKGTTTTDDPSTGKDGITKDDKGIEFGGNGIFRVGDGRAEDSSCKTTLDTFELEGSAFSFEFNVLEDDTEVEISVNRICAIDYDDSNFISLIMKEAILSLPLPLKREVLPTQVIAVGDEPLAPFSSSFTLKKGSYAIRVESQKNSNHGSDRDDFIIGNIRVNANKPVVGTAIQTN